MAYLVPGAGLPVSGVAASTTTPLAVGSVELGHASDTTLSRSAAGKLAVEGVDVVLLSGAQTLVSKTLTSPTLTTPALGTPASGTLTNCTGLPVAGIAASTSTALGVGSVEVGHASDTTIARASAGKISVEGVNVVTTSSTDTMTNKTLTDPKVNAIFDPSTGSVVATFVGPGGVANYLQFSSAAAGGALTIAAQGNDTDVPVLVAPKGAAVTMLYGTSGQTVMALAARGSATNVDLNLTSQGAGRVEENGNIVASRVSVPASASAAGKVGQFASDANFHYDCIATNTWVRSAAATW